jgi:hypothetical protein
MDLVLQQPLVQAGECQCTAFNTHALPEVMRRHQLQGDLQKNELRGIAVS